jgi:hypothetical protein
MPDRSRELISTGSALEPRGVTWKYRYVSGEPCISVLPWVPSPICLGSVSPSPYRVARHKSPKEPRAAPNNLSSGWETYRQTPVDPPGQSTRDPVIERDRIRS